MILKPIVIIKDHGVVRLADGQGMTGKFTMESGADREFYTKSLSFLIWRQLIINLAVDLGICSNMYFN